MSADFVYQPVSGNYQEFIFDVETIWRSDNWSWVRFISDEDEWYGAFRGYPLKIAINYYNNYCAILTEETFFIVDIETKQLIYKEEGTVVRDIIYSDLKKEFVISTYHEIGLLNSQFSIDFFNIQEQLDYIKLLNIDNEYLYFKCDVVKNYEYHGKKGCLNLQTSQLGFE